MSFVGERQRVRARTLRAADGHNARADREPDSGARRAQVARGTRRDG